MATTDCFVSVVDLKQITSVHPGDVVYPPRGQCGPRIQLYLQLVFLMSGSMTVHIDGKPYPIPVGHVALLTPDHLEFFEFATDQETWHRWIAVRVDPVSAQVTAHLANLPLHIPISEEMSRLMDIMLQLRRHSPSTHETLRSFGLAALQLYETESHLSLNNHFIHSSIAKAKTYIEKNYAQHISLSSLAHHVGLSEEHLVRLFHKSEAMTPMKFVWRFRIVRATEMLVQTGLSVGEIASRCGFKTSYHFARMVKSVTKKTPSQIRLDAWKGNQRESE
jgi:AraC family transcriptional regulator of arabinose operon